MSTEAYKMPLSVKLVGALGIAAMAAAFADFGLEHTTGYDLLPGHLDGHASARDYSFLRHPSELLETSKYTINRSLTLAGLTAFYASSFVPNQRYKLLLLSSSIWTGLSLEQLAHVSDHLTLASGLQWGGSSVFWSALVGNNALKSRHASNAA